MGNWMRQVAAVVLAMIALAVTGTVTAKDGVIEILGTVQAMPAAGLVGDWTIAGRSVRTDG